MTLALCDSLLTLTQNQRGTVLPLLVSIGPERHVGLAMTWACLENKGLSFQATLKTSSDYRDRHLPSSLSEACLSVTSMPQCEFIFFMACVFQWSLQVMGNTCLS